VALAVIGGQGKTMGAACGGRLGCTVQAVHGNTDMPDPPSWPMAGNGHGPQEDSMEPANRGVRETWIAGGGTAVCRASSAVSVTAMAEAETKHKDAGAAKASTYQNAAFGQAMVCGFGEAIAREPRDKGRLAGDQCVCPGDEKRDQEHHVDRLYGEVWHTSFAHMFGKNSAQPHLIVGCWRVCVCLGRKRAWRIVVVLSHFPIGLVVCSLLV